MKFSEIIGQDRASALLQRAVAKDTVASAYLFCGPEGVGKASAAMVFAQAMQCERRAVGTAEPCGSCSACEKVAQKSHPDVHWLQPDGVFLKIDQIRELKQKVALRAHEGKRKIGIISQADKMHPAAANAFLKTLEEPSEDTRFVMLAQSARYVLPTIRSRCQHVSFVPLAEEQLVSILLKTGVEVSVAREAARSAEGSAGRALRMLESSSGFASVVEAARKLESSVRETDPSIALRVAEELAKNLERQEIQSVLAQLSLWFRDVICATAGAPMLCNEPKAAQQAQRYRLSDAVACQDACLAAADSLSRNANTQLVLESLVFSLRKQSGVARGRARK